MSGLLIAADVIHRLALRRHTEVLATVFSFLVSATGAVAQNATSNTAPLHSKGQYLNVNPYFAVCSAANCGATGNLTSWFLNGNSTMGSDVSEWLGIDSYYINTGSPNGQKVARYIGAIQGPNTGAGWALNTDIVRNALYDPHGRSAPRFPGWIGSGMPGNYAAVAPGNATVGAELDYTNWDKDILTDKSTGAGSFGVDLYIHNQSRFAAWAGVYLDSHPQDNYPSTQVTSGSWSGGRLRLVTRSIRNGIQRGDYVTLSGFVPSSINGEYFAQSGTGCTYPDSTTCSTKNKVVVSLAGDPGTITTYGSIAAYHNFAWHNGVWLNGPYVAKDNSFLEGTHAANGYQAQGNHSGSDFFANGLSNYGFLTARNHEVSDFAARGSGPIGLLISGTRLTAAIDTRSAATPNALLASAGQRLCLNGRDGCWIYVTGKGISYQQDGAPTLSIDTKGTLIQNGKSYFADTVKLGAHIKLSGAAPTISSCGSTLKPEPNSTDIAGGVSIPAGTARCTVTFAGAYDAPPFIALGQVGANAGAYLSAKSVSAFTIAITPQASSIEIDWTVN